MSTNQTALSEFKSESDTFVLSSRGEAETVVRTLRDNSGWCYWCLCPLEVNPIVQFTEQGPTAPINTADTFEKFGTPIEDVPPDRTESGRVVEYGREKETICGNCGVLDVDPSESRSKETTRTALRHVVSVLEENGLSVNRLAASRAVDRAFADGRTGQFVTVISEAIYSGVSDG